MKTSFASADKSVVVISVSGDVDAFAAPELKEQLFACLDCGAERVIVDMSASAFIDSTGLGVLVAGLKRARGRELSVVSDDAGLRRIFHIVGLDRVFSLYRTRPEALRGPPAS